MQTPTCNGCCIGSQMMRLSWQLGYLRALTERNGALLEQALAILRTPSPAPTQRPGPWGLRDWVERAELAQRGLGVAVGLGRLWRMVSWPVFAGAWGAAAARWLGLL